MLERFVDHSADSGHKVSFLLPSLQHHERAYPIRNSMSSPNASIGSDTRSKQLLVAARARCRSPVNDHREQQPYVIPFTAGLRSKGAASESSQRAVVASFSRVDRRRPSSCVLYFSSGHCTLVSYAISIDIIYIFECKTSRNSRRVRSFFLVPSLVALHELLSHHGTMYHQYLSRHT